MGHYGIADVDVIFPVALIGGRDVTNIGAGKQNQGAEITRLHLFLETQQTILAQPVKVHTVLPVRRGLTVDTARIPFMGLAYETDIHLLCLPTVNFVGKC